MEIVYKKMLLRGVRVLQVWSVCISPVVNRCRTVFRQEDSTHDHQGVPTRTAANPTPESLPDSSSQKEGTLCRLSKAVSPGVIEGRGFVMNRVLGFMIDKKRHVCQD